MPANGSKLKDVAICIKQQKEILAAKTAVGHSISIHPQQPFIMLAKELIFEVLKERIRLSDAASTESSSSPSSMSSGGITNEEQMRMAQSKTNLFLEESMSAEIHVSMGHSDCAKSPRGEAKSKEECPATQKLEVYDKKMRELMNL